ncbi:MAG: Na+/H+ antiporter NhaA [Ktedonobacteraceae bacterium]
MKTRIFQPENRPLAERLLTPFQEFVHAETSSGILLLVCTIIALFLANSPWATNYEHFWEIHLSLGFPGVLLAFLVSGVGGFLLLRWLGNREVAEHLAPEASI